VRLAGRFLVALLVSYGPLAPIVLLYLLAMPPLMALSGWPWWVDLVLASLEVGVLAGVALWLGPGLVADLHAFLEEEKRA
jgi:hypothetical protein